MSVSIAKYLFFFASCYQFFSSLPIMDVVIFVVHKDKRSPNKINYNLSVFLSQKDMTPYNDHLP